MTIQYHNVDMTLTSRAGETKGFLEVLSLANCGVIQLSTALMKGAAGELYLEKTHEVCHVYNIFYSLAGFSLKFGINHDVSPFLFPSMAGGHINKIQFVPSFQL